MLRCLASFMPLIATCDLASAQIIDGTTSLIDGYDLTDPEDLIDMNGALYFNAEDISGDSEIYVYFPDDLTV